MRSQCIYCVTKNYSVTQKSAAKYCESVSRSVVSDSLQPHGLYLPGSSVHGILQAEILQWIAILFSRESSWPRIKPGFSALQADSLPSEPPLSQSVPSLSRVRLFATPWTAARQASLSITNSQSLPKLMSIELVMPSNHVILCRPLLLLPSIFPSIRVFSNQSARCIRWPKYWSFSFSVSPSNEHPGLISFRMDWLDLLTVQETLKSLLQHHSLKASGKPQILYTSLNINKYRSVSLILVTTVYYCKTQPLI